MRRNRCRLLVCVVAATLGLAVGVAGSATSADSPAMAIAGGAATAGLDLVPVDDPFPIRRIRVSPDRVGEALQHFRQGTMVRMPRAEFEDRVKKAGRVNAKSREAPRIVNAIYAAVLSGNDLRGSAEITVVNTKSLPGWAALHPLRLAIRSANWEDNRPAIVGTPTLPGQAGPAVWLDKPGRHALKLDWSAAGVAEQGEQRFDIRVPPSAVSVFEITLPADRTPTVISNDVLISSSATTPGDPANRVWQFRLGESSRLEFSVRVQRTLSTGPTLASLVTRYDITPGQITSTFEYDLQPTRGPVGEWLFAVDPGLQVTDVVVNNRSGTPQLIESPLGLAPRWLRVILKQPGPGGKLLISAVSPLNDRSPGASLPVARPIGAVVQDERLELRLHPELDITGWSSGDYRIVDSAVANDRTRVMNLIGSWTSPGSTSVFRRTPWLDLGNSTSEFSTKEGLEWRVEGGRIRLIVHLAIRVKRGPMFGLNLAVPPGFDHERTIGSAEDLISYVGPLSALRPGVEIEFSRPLTSGRQVEFRLEFRGRPFPDRSITSQQFSLPQVTPLGASERDGWISVAAIPGWILASTPVVQSTPIAHELHQPPADAAITIPYRGRPPQSWVQLRPAPTEYTTRTETRIGLQEPGVMATTRMSIQVTSGAVQSLCVLEPAPGVSGRSWKIAAGNTAIANVSSLDLTTLFEIIPQLIPGTDRLAPGVGMRAILESTWGHGKLWLIQFARPITREAVLESTVTATPIETSNPRDPVIARYPQLQVSGATGAPQVVLEPALVTRYSTDSIADREFPKHIVLRVCTPSERTADAGTFSDLQLTTSVAERETLCVLKGTVTGTVGWSFPVRLPPGAILRSVRINDHWLRSPTSLLEAETNEPLVHIIVPAGSGPTFFEVSYRLPVGSRKNWWQVQSRVPTLPEESLLIRKVWILHDNILAVWPLQGWDQSTPFHPADYSSGGMVYQLSGDRICVVRSSIADAIAMSLCSILILTLWVGSRRYWFLVAVIQALVVVALGVMVILGVPGWSITARPPLYTGLGSMMIISIVRVWRKSGALSQQAVLAVPLLLIMPCLLTSAVIFAQVDDVETVLILSGTDPDNSGDVVLVSRSLLDRLATVSQPTVPAPVITDATYEARVEGNVAQVTARFSVAAFHDQAMQLSLPLADVRLEQVTVDGKVAYPQAVRPDLYTVPISGSRVHQVDVRFVTQVQATGPEREIKFGVPLVPDSQIAFNVFGNPRQLQATGRLGQQSVSPGLRGSQILWASVGGLRTITVRWRQAADGTPSLKIREACIWDVSEAGADLTACYQVRVEQGSVSRFQIGIPAELEPTRVAIRSLDATTGTAVLRDWNLGLSSGGWRPLEIRLFGPTDGRMLIVLECVPREVLTSRPVLKFPRFEYRDRPDPPDAVYGLRTSKITIGDVARTGVYDYTDDGFVREFGSVPDLRLEPGPHLRAYRPVRGIAPELRPILRPGAETSIATTDTTWHLGPRSTEVLGTINWTGTEPLSWFEFELSGARTPGFNYAPITVLEVRGPEIADWCQTGGGFRSGFGSLSRKVRSTGIGTTPRSTSTTPEIRTLEMFTPKPIGLRIGTEIIRIRPANNLTIRIERDRGWKRNPQNGDRGWVFQSDGTPAPVLIQVYPPTVVGPARGFGLLDVTQQEVVYRGIVAMPILPGRQHTITLYANHLDPGAIAELDAPPEVRVTDLVNTTTSKVWSLDIPPTASVLFRVAVVIRYSSTNGAAYSLPIVDVGIGSEQLPSGGLIRLVGFASGDRLAKLEGATQLIGQGWQFVSADWPGESLRLRQTGGSVWEFSRASRSPVLVLGGSLSAEPPTRPERQIQESLGPVIPTTVKQFPEPQTQALPAAVWSVAVLAVIILLTALPRSTWPEQLALLSGLIGTLATGNWGLGVLVLAAARLGWLIRVGVAR